MTDTGKNLADLRREIDQIDNEIHRCIMQRSALVQEIAAQKPSHGTVMRPGREAQVIRRLIAEHQGSFPKLALIQIWREIISAFIGMQRPFAVAVYSPDGSPRYEKLARQHFGSLAPITGHPSKRGVLRAISEGNTTLGVLPLPKAEDPDPWWRFLGAGNGNSGQAGQRIVARLPFAQQSGSDGTALQALVISQGAPEESGLDRSFIILEMAAKTSRGALFDLLGKGGFEPLQATSWQEAKGPYLNLVEVTGFVADGDDRLAKLEGLAGKPNGRAWSIGGFAVPLGPAELAETAVTSET